MSFLLVLAEVATVTVASESPSVGVTDVIHEGRSVVLMLHWQLAVTVKLFSSPMLLKLRLSGEMFMKTPGWITVIVPESFPATTVIVFFTSLAVAFSESNSMVTVVVFPPLPEFGVTCRALLSYVAIQSEPELISTVSVSPAWVRVISVMLISSVGSSFVVHPGRMAATAAMASMKNIRFTMIGFSVYLSVLYLLACSAISSLSEK